MALNHLQEVIAAFYCNGDLSHVKSMEDAEACGDTMFLFLLREANDAKGNKDEFLEMLSSACDELDRLDASLRGYTRRL